MALRRLVFVLVALMATAALASSSWRSYFNERFGTTADVPADWRPGEPPENGDGLVFTSPNGDATITVSGSLNISDTIAEAFSVYEAPNEGETITYHHRDKRAVVVSGTNGTRIFYRKSILSCRDEVWNSVTIEYPAADKKAYDALVTHVAGSLHAGASEQVAECP